MCLLQGLTEGATAGRSGRASTERTLQLGTDGTALQRAVRAMLLVSVSGLCASQGTLRACSPFHARCSDQDVWLERKSRITPYKACVSLIEEPPRPLGGFVVRWAKQARRLAEAFGRLLDSCSGALLGAAWSRAGKLDSDL